MFKLVTRIHGIELMLDTNKNQMFFMTHSFPLSTGRFTSVLKAAKAVYIYEIEGRKND